MLDATQLKQYRRKKLKQAIIKTASRTLVNKPIMTGFKIEDERHLDEVMSYSVAKCQLRDEYTCPITKVKTIDLYHAVYDGMHLVLAPINA